MIDLDELQQLVVNRRARLATTVGVQTWLHLDQDPDKLVLELLRLARIGQTVEFERLHGTIGRAVDDQEARG